LINLGGASGENDLAHAARTAVIDRRAGGTGLIGRRKGFQKPMKDGVQILRAIHDVYLNEGVIVAQPEKVRVAAGFRLSAEGDKGATRSGSRQLGDRLAGTMAHGSLPLEAT
jgi:hypothetical protein